MQRGCIMSFGNNKSKARSCKRQLRQGTVTGPHLDCWEALAREVQRAENDVWNRKAILGEAHSEDGTRLLAYTTPNSVIADMMYRQVRTITGGKEKSEPAEELVLYLGKIVGAAIVLDREARVTVDRLEIAFSTDYNRPLIEMTVAGIATGIGLATEYNHDISNVEGYFDRFIGSL